MTHFLDGLLPREKLLEYGADKLSDRELLAILLRTGIKNRHVVEYCDDILSEFGGFRGLYKSTPSELMEMKGLKKAKVATILAAVEIGKRFSMIDRGINNEKDWYKYLDRFALDCIGEQCEYIFVIFLDSKEQYLSSGKISYGGLQGAFLDMPALFRKAVRVNARYIVLSHNHPNGTQHPSREDYGLTEHVENCLKVLGMKLKGHYIAANGKLIKIETDK